jgi:4-hydroxy-tetrahydrodipicolinate synthase
LRILGGLGAIMLLEELRRGAVGTMTGFGFPEILVDIVGRYRAGDETGAREVFHTIMPLIRFENQPGINLAIRKHLYQRRGAIATARLRAPGASIDAGTIADLEIILESVGLADRLPLAG